MKTVNYHSKEFLQFLQSFCSTDSMRKKLMKPTVCDDGFVFATDAHQMIFFYDKEFAKVHAGSIIEDGLDEKGNHKTVDGKAVTSEYLHFLQNSTQVLGEISVSKEVLSIIESIRTSEKQYSYKYKDCPECEGYGEVECECCGNNSKCKDCHGNGVIRVSKDEVGSYWKYPDEQRFKITAPAMKREISLGLPVFANIAQNMTLLSFDILQVLDINEVSTKIFCRIKDTDLYMLIMGLMPTNDYSDFTTYEIKLSPEN